MKGYRLPGNGYRRGGGVSRFSVGWGVNFRGFDPFRNYQKHFVQLDSKEATVLLKNMHRLTKQ